MDQALVGQGLRHHPTLRTWKDAEKALVPKAVRQSTGPASDGHDPFVALVGYCAIRKQIIPPLPAELIFESHPKVDKSCAWLSIL
jgi:hypothetical protein